MDDAALLAALPGMAFAFVLVLARAGLAVMLLPGLGDAEVPMPVRAGLAAALAAVLLPAVLPDVPPAPDDPFRALSMVAAELLAGGVLGWMARMAVLALPVAGGIVSYMLGLSSVLQSDPQLGQTAALGRLFGLAASVFVLATGLYALPLQALAGSYRLVPPGTLPAPADTVQLATGAVAESFGLALRLAAPFIVASVVWQAGLALLAKLAPQLQVFTAAAPGQILGGLLLLALVFGALLDAWGEGVRATFLSLPGS